MLAVSVTRLTIGAWQQLEPIVATTTDSRVSSATAETSDSQSTTTFHVIPGKLTRVPGLR